MKNYIHHDQGLAPPMRDSVTPLRPTNVAEVQHMVREARARRHAIHPISTGLNWGYSNDVPADQSTVLMDLGGMRGIRNAAEISERNPVAVIEPGVTQWQLHEFLSRQAPGLMFNVTGSARETNIIGNALDRGVGYLGPRRDDLFGLEVVIGTGEVIQTGFRRLGDDSPLAHCHPFGLGPMLDGLFFQGNFGIVTSACFRLVPKPPRQLAVSLSLLRAADLPQFIDVLAALKRERIMGSVTHIGNQARTQASLGAGISGYLSQRCGLGGVALEQEARRAIATVAPHEWTSLGGISGTDGQVRAALAEVRRRMRKLARVGTFDNLKLERGYAVLDRLRVVPWARANAAAIHAIRPLHGLAVGVPTDAAIDNLLWRFGRPELPATQLMESDCGILFISPALPMDGAFAADVVAGMTAIAREHSHALYVTINIETESSLVAVTNLLFDRRNPDALRSANVCADALHGYIRSRSLEVYRARNDMMPAITDAGSPYWQAVSRLKAALDPDGVISPGHYSLVQPDLA